MKHLARKIKRRIKSILTPPKHAKILDEYVSVAPSAQLALDIFKGEWASQLPPPFETLKAGGARLFEDDRITWGLQQFGGVQDKNVIELGPLEGGHTYMLERAGAKSIVAIEANTRAYLKCLVVKELLKLQRADFLCGDFVEYLRANQRTFDLCVASGVLYHMRNPVELIGLIAKSSSRVLMWTHYFDQERAEKDPAFAVRFKAGAKSEHGGFSHTLYKQEYYIDVPGFCGGNAHFSCWLPREDILNAFRHFGLTDIRITMEDKATPNGPCFTFTAARP